MNEINEISLEGFQVVSRDYFYGQHRLMMPSMTFWDGSIGFTKQDVVMLNGCECVLLQINTDAKKVLVVPTTSKDTDSIHWIKNRKTMNPRKISCKKLTDQVYKMWGWNTDYIYRAQGKLVTAGNKVMLLFDFSEPENWLRPEAKKV